MNSSNIVIFDGVCKFCSGAVNFIIQRDPHAKFRFTPRQGRLGKELMQKHQIQESGGESLILIKDGTYFLRTDAALEIASELSWPWPAFRVFKILPRAFRDFFYRVFARYRYTLFGKRDVCVVPTEDVRSRFIE